MARDYSAHGLAGCVRLRTARTTGTKVGVYNAEQAGMDDGDGALPWVTVCEAHGALINHETLALAKYHAVMPQDWCGSCQEAL